MSQPKSCKQTIRQRAICLLILQATPLAAFGQASPFDTGADSLLTWALGIAMPIAALFIIGLGIAALVGRISAGLAVGCIVGIALIFGAPQIVTWMRGMFGV
ncbi:TrbC/VirB2 family protein [Steroidobacter flavus]|uniref:TrbC/VirB2 family protein n=1 Tax=Steroidobacter flavus TaxID=1842136 RepID=A0ABV8SYG1_9GAMM